ncbi:phosphoribosyltransferase family protein [Isoptericola sp. NPDC057191]|uniref:phosphoribosyltransferase family protein n=1 Tax=Isoptericola sp. NPDC057191 TaxID=3346041 RepID=UPI0036300651
MTVVAGPDRTVTRVAAHRLTHPDDVVRHRPGGLDLDAYSRMKHGDLRATGILAKALAAALVDQVPTLVSDDAVPILPVAYKAVRPACWFLARAVLDDLDARRAAAGLPAGRIVRVAKDAVTTTDYATASAAERSAELGRIGFRLDEDVDGAQLVVIDDVRVTGSAETSILAALDAARPQKVVLAYVAVVEGGLAADPAVEAALNHHVVRSPADLAGAVRRGDFVLTIRFLKRLLQAPADERAAFLDSCPPALLHEVLDGAAATGDEFCMAFAGALGDVRARLRGVR